MSATRASFTLVRRLFSRQQVEIIARARSYSIAHPTLSVYSTSCDGATNISKTPYLRLRHFSSAKSGGNTEEGVPDDKPQEQNDGSTTNSTGEATAEEQVETITREEELEAQIKELKDQLKYSLAEQQNIRFQAQRDVDSARQFAVSSFAKSLLETSDNLERAMEAVPVEVRNDKENHPDLCTLFEGIKMTEDIMLKAFEKNGLKKFGIKGEKFDPNKHNALFVYPDPTGKNQPGSIGTVMKAGFTLHGRVIRPADVGVIEKK